MQITQEFELEDSCSYLSNKLSKTEYKLVENCSRKELSEFLEHGYRRFGKILFRPICKDCCECQSIKIDIANFSFTKSKRRIIKKASHIKTHIQKPLLSQEHLNLYEKYHLFMKEKKEWEYKKTTFSHYYNSFVEGANDYAYEILYLDEEKLIGVDLIDIVDNALSSIYFYYDPDYSKYSLGKLSMYNQILIAKENNLKWVYLGYYVKECPSLSYKAEYKPYLTLQKRPNIDETTLWIE
jgi:arginine-tRNA-protein transferase